MGSRAGGPPCGSGGPGVRAGRRQQGATRAVRSRARFARRVEITRRVRWGIRTVISRTRRLTASAAEPGQNQLARSGPGGLWSAAVMQGVFPLALLVALLSGCSRGASGVPSSGGRTSSAPENSAPRVTAEELTAPESLLTVGALVLERDGKPALELKQDGALDDVAEKRLLGKLAPDGSFADPTGKVVARLAADGEVELSNGDFLPATIDRDGTVNMLKEGRKVRVRDDGTLEGANPGGPVIKFTGITRDTRRTAMFLLVLAAFPVQTKP